MSLSFKSYVDESPDHIYYNVSILNNNSVGENPVFVNFNDVRSSPVIQKANDYYFSIIRFSLDTNSLPVFIPQIEIGQSNPNKTIYSFTLTCLSGSTILYGQQNLIWETQRKDVPIPPAPITEQQDSVYYYGYDIQHFYKLVNNTLSTAYATLDSQVPGGLSSHPPFFQYDVNTKKAILVADATKYLNTLPNPVKIYCNGAMWNLLGSFEAEYYGLSNGRDYQYTIRNINFSNLLKVPQNFTATIYYTGLQSYQEESTTNMLNPVQAIVFTSTMLPIASTVIAKPQVFNSDSTLTVGGLNNNFAIIATDFVAGSYLNEILYNPTSEYRLIDCNSNSPIQNIDLQIFWQDKYNNLRPFYLNSGGTSQIKFMWRKKTFNKNV